MKGWRGLAVGALMGGFILPLCIQTGCAGKELVQVSELQRDSLRDARFMPHGTHLGVAYNEGVALHYEVHGEGPTMILISGFGADRHMWFPQVGPLSAKFQVVAFDNRGTGLSDRPDMPYSTALYASDVVAILDELGVEKAIVVGASMGGFVAQELALLHPERVEALALLCTNVGGTEHVPADPQVIRQMLTPMEDPGDKLIHAYGMFTSPGWVEANNEALQWLADVKRARPTDKVSYRNQLSLAANFSSASRLSTLDVKTLILHGSDDEVVPAANGDLLHGKISNSELVKFDGLGHAFFVEGAEQVNAKLLAFFDGASSQ